MNFQLKLPVHKKNKKKSKPLSTGLNARGDDTARNVFASGDSDHDEDKNPINNNNNNSESSSSYRENVNRAIRQEQEAMRKRAEQSMKRAAAQEGSSIYDYDGNYESFSSSKQNEQANRPKQANDGQSRYMGELLKAAKERSYERDIAYERKMARELEQEENENAELQDKDKFITAGYKRKLEERKLWKASRDKLDEEEEKLRQQQEASSDAVMANFHGNFTKNVAMGGAHATADKGVPVSTASGAPAAGVAPADSSQKPSSVFEGLELAQNEKGGESAIGGVTTTKAVAAGASSDDPETARLERRRIREEKVAQARERYFRRHAIQ
ncbi:hypothetical protein ACA910_020150 [Epithemia clementina (nom. ined.)]